MSKSQAALEFLTTYAWAFLGIMVTLGALYYFGIFDFSKYLPQECIFPSQFECVAFSFVGGATDQIRFRIVNNAGETVNVKGYSIGNDMPTPLSCSNPSAFSGWLSGEERDFVFTGCSEGGFIDNERTEAKISITYCAPATTGCTTGSAVDHTLSGKIKAVVT